MEGQRRTWTPPETEVYANVMALRKQSRHKEHVYTPSGPASRRARWHETSATFDLMVVYFPGKDSTVADCLSRGVYPASKGMTDVSAHGDEAETAEARRMTYMEGMMEEECVKCFVGMAADAALRRRVSRAVRLLASEGAELDKHLFLQSEMIGRTTMPSLRLLSPSTGLLLTRATVRSGRRGLLRKTASSTRMVGC